jgi:hypothetical protein
MGSGKARNKPCPCGSGMKMKHCSCQTRRPRTTVIQFDYGVPTTINKLQVSESGIMSLQLNGKAKQPVAAHLETTYERVGKHPKVIHHTPLDPAAPGVNPNLVLERFDLLLAIDTNTVSNLDGSISLAVVVKCEYHDLGENRLAHWEPVHAIEFHNITGKAENIAWRTVIENIAATPHFDALASIGVVIDSDFGRIAGFNSRSVPIESDFYLPPKFELLYATADAGSEYVANRMLARANQVSRAILRQMSGGKLNTEGLHPVQHAPFTHYRIWEPLPDSGNTENNLTFVPADPQKDAGR